MKPTFKKTPKNIAMPLHSREEHGMMCLGLHYTTVRNRCRKQPEDQLSRLQAVQVTQHKYRDSASANVIGANALLPSGSVYFLDINSMDRVKACVEIKHTII